MRTLLSLALVSIALACKEPPPQRVQGQLLVPAKARELWAAPNGNAVATLADAAPSGTPGAPADLVLGRLLFAGLGGGPLRALGSGVSNLPGSVLYSKDGLWIGYVADYSVKQAAGELRLAKVAGGEPEVLGKGVSFFTFSPKSDAIAWVADGTLWVRTLADGQTREVGKGVSFAEFGPAGTPAEGHLLVKRTVRVDGALLTYDVATGKLAAVARGVGASGWSPDGESIAFQAEGLLAAEAVEPASKFAKVQGDEGGGLYLRRSGGKALRVAADGASEFKFSPDGKRLAYVTPPVNGNAGDLYVVEGDAAPKKITSRVAQFIFAQDGSLALLGAYDRSASAGTLGVLTPAGALVEVSRSVRQFSVSPKGRHLIYLHGVVRNTMYSLGLAVHRIGAKADEKSRELDIGVSGYTLDEAETKLAYKAHCIDEGRTCSLLVADLEKDTPPTLLAARIGAFEFAPGGLAVITSRPAAKLSGKLFFSLGTVPLTVPEGAKTAPITVLDDHVAGDFVRVGEGGKRIAYVIDEPGREGVGLVNLPAP